MLLSSANNSPIKCLGCIKLNVRIGSRVNYEKFYITTDKCNNILGLPGIKAFDMVIDIKREICQVPPNTRQVNAITENKVSNFIKLTPAKKYLITVQTPQLIELSLCLANRGLDLLNKRVVIFYCQCLYADNKLCSACAVEIPYISYVQLTDNRGIIRIKYQPQMLQNLYPGKDFLQGILI